MMKSNSKGFTLIEVIATLTILAIIGLIATVIVVGVVKDIREDADKISIKNYANSVVYATELYVKNNNQIPTWCTIKDDVVFYDTNYNNIYDSNELVCNNDCENDDCIKNFITTDDVKNKNKKINCDKIIINEDGSIELSNCTVKGKEIKKYSYKTTIETVNEQTDEVKDEQTDEVKDEQTDTENSTSE